MNCRASQKLINWHLAVTYAYVFSLPFGIYFSLKMLILWAITGILTFCPQNIKPLKHKFFIYWSFVYVLAFAIGVLYSQAKNEAIELVGIKLLLPALVILTAASMKHYNKRLDLLLSIFILGAVTSALVLWIIALFKSIEFNGLHHIVFDPRVDKTISLKQAIKNNKVVFLYRHFSVFMHPGYRAMYYVFAIAAWAFLLKTPDKSHFHKLTRRLLKPPLPIIGILFLTITVFLLSSRANFLSLILLYTLLFLMSKIRYKLAIIAVISVALVLLFSFNPRSQLVIKNFYLAFTKHQLTDTLKVKRIILWSTGFEIAKKHWLTGVGTGDLQWLLMKYNAKKGYLKLANPKYNTHNELLETWAKLGIWGLAILIIWFAYPLIIAIKQKRYLLGFLMVLLLTNFMFEVVMNREVGLIFIAFFITLLLYSETPVFTPDHA